MTAVGTAVVIGIDRVLVTVVPFWSALICGARVVPPRLVRRAAV